MKRIGQVNKYLETYSYADYDSVIIWLGTNYGCSAMPTDDEISAFVPDSSVAAADAEQALYLAYLIETIQSANADCFMVLCNCYSSKSDTTTNNTVLSQMAEKYGMLLVDMSDLTAANYPELHAGISNPHLGKAGNIYVAKRICDAVSDYFGDNPVLCEFGLSARTN